MGFHAPSLVLDVQTTIGQKQCSDCFTVSRFGLPDSVHSDHGGEITAVWRYMIATHGDYSCVLTGSSIHNEWIEHLWRDVHRCIVGTFANTFRGVIREMVFLIVLMM